MSGFFEEVKRRKVNRLALALAALLSLATTAGAEWRMVSQTNESSATGVVTHRHIVAEEASTGNSATLDLAFFSTQSATLRVIDDSQAHDSLGETMAREHCLAGVNGGYFDPNYAPVGLLISNGQVIAKQTKARLLSGVVSVANGRVQIWRAAEFSIKSKPTAARQCGPFLVDRGHPIAGLNDTRSARRTFVLTAPNEKSAIGYCSHVTLAQLAEILSTPGLLGEASVSRALNLDGGSSSGFWFDAKERPFSISEQKTVRDYLAIVPKPASP